MQLFRRNAADWRNRYDTEPITIFYLASEI